MVTNTRSARPLSDTQLVLLSSAALHQDRLVIPPVGIDSAAFARALKGLLERGLVESAPTPPGASGRTDAAERAIARKITPAGLEAIGIAPEAEGSHGESVTPEPVPASREPRESPTEDNSQQSASATLIDGPAGSGMRSARPGTKQALVITLLSRPGGATLDDLIAATGWLPHTTRAALTGLRQKGYALTRSKCPDGKSIYCLPGAEA